MLRSVSFAFVDVLAEHPDNHRNLLATLQDYFGLLPLSYYFRHVYSRKKGKNPSLFQYFRGILSTRRQIVMILEKVQVRMKANE
jgi:hypothetical protein